MSQPDNVSQPEENLADVANEKDSRLKTFIIVRGYVLLAVGVFLIVISFQKPYKPATLTLGGAMIGFNPILRSVQG